MTMDDTSNVFVFNWYIYYLVEGLAAPPIAEHEHNYT